MKDKITIMIQIYILKFYPFYYCGKFQWMTFKKIFMFYWTNNLKHHWKGILDKQFDSASKW